MREFELRFAQAMGARAAVAVNSGTSALHAAVAAADIAEGDEVIVPAAAYVSAASVLVQQGAIPVLADIDPATMTISIEDAERKITGRTRAVIPVHFWGCPSDMHRLMELAARRSLVVIEDCGQSHGATVGGRITGAIGEFGCFSFAPRKHITTGQGGMVTCASTESAERVRELVNKGKGDGWLAYNELGFSYAMAEIEGALGLDGLAQLPAEVARRREAATIYRRVLSRTPLEIPADPPWGRHVYFKIPIVIPESHVGRRDHMVAAIAEQHVSCRPTHPPVQSIEWLATYVAARGRPFERASLPAAESVLPRAIEVESGPNLTSRDLEASAEAVLRAWTEIC